MWSNGLQVQVSQYLKMIKDTVMDYLESEPRFRERKNKDRGMVNLLAKKYHKLKEVVEMGLIDKETVIAIIQDYASMDRAWRQALEKNPRLRGTDYDQKEELENKKLEELGYRVPDKQGKLI
jgi:serine/threonine-protein kinase RIO1